MAEQLQVRIVCAPDLLDTNRTCAEVGVWFADIAEVRDILLLKAAAANALSGAGTHWLETRNVADAARPPSDRGLSARSRLDGDPKPSGA